MNKVFSSGRLQVVLNDGSKMGKQISLPNLVENSQPSQIAQVVAAIGTLASFPVSDVKVTEVYRYDNGL